jgi:RHS repeat-associated protein
MWHRHTLIAATPQGGGAPHGAIQQITYGAGRYEQTCYDSRLQVQTILLRTVAPTGLLCTDATNNLWKLSLDYGTSNNGNLMGATMSDGASWTVAQNFSYDKLNRLASAEEPAVSSGLSWKRTFGYDRWGNQWVDGNAANSYGIGLDTVTPNGSTWITAKNRLNLSRGSYDRAGNLLAISGSVATYDAENRVSSLNPTFQYSYDGEGRRVKKVLGSATTQYVYDAFGQLAEEYTTGTVAASSCTTCYLVADHLGSTRALWDSTGVRARYDYMPFGELIPGDRNNRSSVSCAAGVSPCYAGDGSLSMRFTGKERDADTTNSGMSTGLDYFGARYFSAAQGRFTSPDWSEKPQAIPYADLTNPQTVNLYAYVVNNPLNRTDPLGHNWFYIDDKWEWYKGKAYTRTDSQGNQQTFKSNYTGLLVAERTGTSAKGATTYKLTLYDQNKVASSGTGFSGGRDEVGRMHPAVQDANYTLRLDIRDPNGPNTINPNSPLNNPPVFYGIQRMHNIPAEGGGAWDVVGAYGYVRSYLNHQPGQPGTDGAFVHGQFNGHGYTHGCLCYGTDRAFGETLWNLPPQRLPVAIDMPVVKP